MIKGLSGECYYEDLYLDFSLIFFEKLINRRNFHFFLKKNLIDFFINFGNYLSMSRKY
jgi:hypothetical protein